MMEGIALRVGSGPAHALRIFEYELEDTSLFLYLIFSSNPRLMADRCAIDGKLSNESPAIVVNT